jgi:hypothetical protein
LIKTVTPSTWLVTAATTTHSPADARYVSHTMERNVALDDRKNCSPVIFSIGSSCDAKNFTGIWKIP